MQLNYVTEQDTTFIRLDSALNLIDTMMYECKKYYAGLVSNKLQILSAKKEYAIALKFINCLDEKEISPLRKFILLKRFEAMQAQIENDTIQKNKLIMEIIGYLKSDLLNDSTGIKTILQLPKVLDIMQHKESLYIIQLYYYRAQIEGASKILNELDSFQQKINGNSDFFEIVKGSLTTNAWLNTEKNEFNLKEEFLFFNGL